MITAVVGFAVVAGMLTVLPGIDTALVLRSSVMRGPRAAYATVAGIADATEDAALTTRFTLH